MNIQLIQANLQDAEKIWRMQVQAFAEQYERYQDHDTNPANESLEKVQDRLNQPDTYYYIIVADGAETGAIRVIDPKNGASKRISPLFLLPEYRGIGIGSAAILAAEIIHGSENWTLSMILQETENCRFYEKNGYQKTDKLKKLNDQTTLAFYRK